MSCVLMSIKFFKFTGKREVGFSRQQSTAATIIVWHENNLRFVAIELQPLLYGLDISSYARDITLQLTNSIPTFEQLSVWMEKIDPKAITARIMVGQLISLGENYQLQLQASDKQSIYIKKLNKWYQLLVDKDGVSGSFDPGDELVLGSQDFVGRHFQPDLNISQQSIDQLNLLLQNQLPDTSVLWISFIKKRKVSSFVWSRIFTILKSKPKESLEKPVQIQDLSVKRSLSIRHKRHSFALLLAILFMILLSISVGLGFRKRAQFASMQEERQLIENVSYRLEQAKSLQELNPQRARILLAEAKQNLTEYTMENKLPSPTIKDLEAEVALAYEQVSGLVLVQEAPIYYDPVLVKDGFVPKQMALSDQDLTMLDPESKVAGTLNLTSKSAKIVAGSSQIQTNSRLATITAWTFLLSDKKLSIIDKNSQKQIKSFALTSTTVSDMVGYGNNLYIMDIPAGQVLRLRGIKDGLSKAEEFFNQQQDLSGAVSLAVDGSVWILYSNGALEKYTSGLRDALYPKIDLDKPLQQASKLFTDENQKNLYILDKSQGRIIAVSKQFEFKAEYNWDGLKSCDSFVVSEEVGKILVLKDGKIWGINLK